MSSDETIRQQMKRLRREVQRAMRAARATAPRGINVARRSNVIVTANVGRDGAAQGASATQHAEIHQGDA